MNLDMTLFHQAFFEEAVDLCADFETNLLLLEDRPGDPELLNTIFRCAHSIKGGSATFGFTEIAHFTHGLETLLDKVRNGKIIVSAELVQLLLESLDQLNALVNAARGEAESAPDGAALLARIEAMAESKPAEAGDSADGGDEAIADPAGRWGIWPSTESIWTVRIVPGPDTLRQGIDPLRLLREMLGAGEMLSIACDLSRVPALQEMDPESCYLGWRASLRTDWSEERLREIFDFIADESEIVFEHQTVPLSEPVAACQETLSAAPNMPAPAPAAAAPGGAADTHTLRVATDKVDKLINLVGELVINQSMLNEVIQDFSMAKLARLYEAVGAMERASRELQERVMAIRMLPIKHAFGRFPRLVRDLAGAVGKKIELKMSGEETELDKGVIEAIADPLTHLVRNSVDHGLETPEQRRAAGKPETGIVSLDAFHEGGSIVIEVSDDGGGLSLERIKNKARELGWIAEGESPSDETAYNYIFQPGFSTAASVTDLSGRGVGMDIVKRAIQTLGGSITLNSSPGIGTRFRIRLPLTMAILEGLSMAVGDETYIVPLTSIMESIQPKSVDVRRLPGDIEVVTVRESVLPIVRLHRLFGTSTEVTDPSRGILVIVENDHRRAALLVDELIGQSQVVIKSLEANYHKVDGFAGATILGNGRVALILDVPSLLRDADRRAGAGFMIAA